MSELTAKGLVRRRDFLRRAFGVTGMMVVGATLSQACATPTAPAPTSAPKPTAAPAGAAPTSAPAAAAAKPAEAAKPAAAATTAPATASRGGELTVAIDSDPITLDTRLTSPTQAYPTVQHITEPLTFRKTDGTVIPWLAESWSQDSDRVWKLKLRPNVKFTNGEPFDAEAAKYSLDCIVTPDLFPKTTPQKRNWLKAIEKVDIVDPTTIAITTKYPSRSMLGYLSLFGMMAPKAAKDAGERWGTAPVGTGPYRMGEYVPGNRLVLEANKDYWGGAPAQDKLTMRYLPEGSTRLAALEAGEVGMINNLPPDQVQRVKSNPNLDAVEVMSTRIVQLYMMTNRAPFQDINARKAVNYAIDKASIVQALLNGHGEVARSVYSPSILYFKEQPAYEYNLDKAKKMIDEAGLTGTKINFGYSFARFLNDRQIAQAIQQQLGKIGFEVSGEPIEWATYRTKQAAGEFDIFFAAYGTLTLDPEYSLGFLYNQGQYDHKYQNPRVDELIMKGDQTTDAKQAEAAYQEAQQIIWQDAPNAHLYYQPELHGVSKKLRNHAPRPDEYWLFKDTYLER